MSGPTVESASFRRGLWTALGVLVTVLLAYCVVQVRDVLVLILIAAFLAIALDLPVRALVRRGMARRTAVLIVVIGSLLVVATIVAVLARVLGQQIATLVDDGPQLLHKLLRNAAIRDLDNRFHVVTQLQDKLKDPQLAQTAVGHAFGIGVSAVNGVANTVIVVVLTIYFLAGLPGLLRAAYGLAPASRRPRVQQLTDGVVRRTGRYVVGVLAVAAVAGTVTFAFLEFAGLGEYALPLAVLVALLDLVPLVGALAGAATVVGVGLANSVGLGIAAAIFYVVYEVIEGYVIYPRVMRSSVDVPEYVTIIAVLIGGSLGGIVGALLSLPVTASALHLVQELWVRRQDAA